MGNSDDRRELFEVARAYRAVYALRTAYDRQPVLTVSAAIAYGELMLRADRLAHPGRPRGIGAVSPLDVTRLE